MTKITKKLSKISTDSGNEVLLRIVLDRKHSFRLKSGLYVPGELWNEKEHNVKIPRIHNEEFKVCFKLKTRICKLEDFLLDRCSVVDPASVNKAFLENLVEIFHKGPSEEAKSYSFDTIFQLFVDDHCERLRRKQEFMCLFRQLKHFEAYYGTDYTLDVNTFDSVDLDSFIHFLRIEHTFFNADGMCTKNACIYTEYPEKRTPKERGTNYIISILKKVRTFFHWVVRRGYTENNPFDDYHISQSVYGTPYFMTIEEKDRLYAFDFSSDHELEIQRDIFVFQSCIGIRVGDYISLTRANVVNGAIEYIASKTLNDNGNTIRVPLCKQAQEILSKYKDYHGDSLFPFISKQKYNDCIKKMLRIAGINRVVTILNPTSGLEEQRNICDVASSHMARRNFIGNLYNKTQDPNLIGSMTGHVEGSKAFARYRTVDDSIKKKLVDVLG